MLNHPYRSEAMRLQEAHKRRQRYDDLACGVMCVVCFLGYCTILGLFLLGG